MSFADSSAVKALGDGRWGASIQPGWDIAGNANGGYLLAISARALAAAAGRPHPITVTAHYLAPGRAGSVTAHATVVRHGTRFATAIATLCAEGRPMLQATGTFADLDALSGPELLDGRPPDLPDPADCIAARPSEPEGFPPPFTAHVDLRLHPRDATFFDGAASGQPLIRGWFRLPHDEPIDPFALLLAADSFPPTIFNTDLPVSWVPTLELTVHVRGQPAPGWLACAFRTRFISNGLLEVDGEIWDSDAQLVAQSRQIALVPRAARS
jgi:acyl-CoA thioesterase